MAIAYYPTSEEDKPRLNILQLEILIFYFRNQDVRFADCKNDIMSKLAQEAHLKLIEWSMISMSDTTTERDYTSGSCRFDITDRGTEHIKRLLKTALPVGRVVYTLPEDDPK